MLHHGHLELFLRAYGLWALFFVAAFEGDIALLLAGMLIHLRVWPAVPAVSVGAAGGFAGDIFFFWLGHGTGHWWLTTAHARRVMPHIDRVAHRYGVLSLFMARYIFGARGATMYYWGMRKLSAARFLPLDIVNCCIWATLYGGIGYLFSSTLEQWIGRIRRIETGLLLGLLVFTAVLGLRYYLVDISPLPGDENDEELRAGHSAGEKPK